MKNTKSTTKKIKYPPVIRMLFIPEKQVKKTLKRLRKESQERMRQESLKRREEYLEAKANNNLDAYYEKYLNNY